MKTKLAGVMVLGWGLVFLSGCAKAPHLRPGYEAPEEIADRYHEALRWQDYESARKYVLPAALPAFDQFVKQSTGNLTVADYTISDAELGDEGYSARVTVKRIYTLAPSATQKEDNMVQTWKLIAGQWLLSGPPF